MIWISFQSFHATACFLQGKLWYDSHLNPLFIPKHNLISHEPVCCLHHPQRLYWTPGVLRELVLSLIYTVYVYIFFLILGLFFLFYRHKLLNLNPWKKESQSFLHFHLLMEEESHVFFFLFDIWDFWISSQTFQKLFDSAIFLCNCVVERVIYFFLVGVWGPLFTW